MSPLYQVFTFESITIKTFMRLMINLVGMQAVGCATIVISFVMGSQLLNSGAISVGKLIGFNRNV